MDQVQHSKMSLENILIRTSKFKSCVGDSDEKNPLDKKFDRSQSFFTYFFPPRLTPLCRVQMKTTNNFLTLKIFLRTTLSKTFLIFCEKTIICNFWSATSFFWWWSCFERCTLDREWKRKILLATRDIEEERERKEWEHRGERMEEKEVCGCW